MMTTTATTAITATRADTRRTTAKYAAGEPARSSRGTFHVRLGRRPFASGFVMVASGLQGWWKYRRRLMIDDAEVV